MKMKSSALSLGFSFLLLSPLAMSAEYFADHYSLTTSITDIPGHFSFDGVSLNKVINRSGTVENEFHYFDDFVDTVQIKIDDGYYLHKIILSITSSINFVPNSEISDARYSIAIVGWDYPNAHYGHGISNWINYSETGNDPSLKTASWEFDHFTFPEFVNNERWTFITRQDGLVNDGRLEYYIDSVSVSFLVSAVPEPSSYAMLSLGLGVLGFAARRGKSA